MPTLKQIFAKQRKDREKARARAKAAPREPFDGEGFARVLLDEGEKEAMRLIRPGLDYDQPGAEGMTPLEFCIHYQLTQPALKVIEYGASVSRRDKDGATPLHNAAYKGLEDVVCALIDKGADVNDGGSGGDTPLDAAARCNKDGRFAIIEELLAKGAAIDKPAGGAMTALMHASSVLDGEKAVKLLLDKGANADIQDRNGDTALIHAVKHSYLRTLEVLIGAKAALGPRNEDGETALGIACRNAFGGSMATMLLDAGADPDTADNDGHTPLMQAAVNLKPAILAKVIARGAALDAQDCEGRSALIWSIQEGREGSARKLLEAGADPTLRDASGRRAIDYTAVPSTIAALNAAEAAWPMRNAGAMERLVASSIALQSDIPVLRALRLRRGPS